MAKLSQAELLDAFASMSVLELSDFKKAFEDKFGVTAAAPVAMGAVAVAAAPTTSNNGSSLPFTGAEVGLIAVAGLALAGTGFALRRASREQE